MLLAAYAVPQEYSEAAINELLDCLTPANARLFWISKQFAEVTTEVEPWCVGGSPHAG